MPSLIVIYIPAIDLDTAERVIFGDPKHSDASVSLAVAVSCAIPRFFRPVSSEGRDFIDGGIADALNLDVALTWGAREVLVVNPMVAPLNDRDCRCLIHTAMSFRLHRLTHPEVAVSVIQPDRMEVGLDSPMDFRGRARILELGEKDGARFASRATRPRGRAGRLRPRRTGVET